MKKNLNSGKEVQVLARHMDLSISKARRVIDQIRGRSYEETLIILHSMPYQASYPVLKLVSSAAANANHNMGLNEADSYISKAEVNRSTIVKRFRPRAKGQSYPIKRTMCHIKIVLKEESKPLLSSFQQSQIRISLKRWMRIAKKMDEKIIK
uniref:Large ribosomal subunit protein uL22c n=1 Tax=Juncus effusus TaxID=13579 RepID=A0A8A3SQQ9_JUNEF|nr:ribosomal protein L22 [Juncus effusus]QSZ78302.1 ribosomal protein L22 [Juncus effusus]